MIWLLKLETTRQCYTVSLFQSSSFAARTVPTMPLAIAPLINHGANLIRQVADEPKFANWLFVCGSVIESDIAAVSPRTKHDAKLRDDLIQAIVSSYNKARDEDTKDFIFSLLIQTMDFAQKHPLVTVKNLCFVYKRNWPEWPTGAVIEKKFVSHEDFVVSYYNPDVYSEMSVAYPYVDESMGELKKHVDDQKSIFRVDGIMVALEICLDHRRARLRQVRKEDAESNVPIDMHLLVSCGMQIQQPSVVARVGGVVFNCDGQYATPNANTLPDDKTCIFTGAQGGKAHSQMTVVTKAADNDHDATCEIPKNVKVTTAPYCAPKNLEIRQLEAYGAGEIHLYSKYFLPS